MEPDVVVAATGYGRGLDALAGRLGVLDDDGLPLRHGGAPAAPGLRFVGYTPGPGQIGRMGREGARAARQIARELRAAR